MADAVRLEREDRVALAHDMALGVGHGAERQLRTMAREHGDGVGTVLDDAGVVLRDADGFSSGVRDELDGPRCSKGCAHGFTLTAARPRVPFREMAQARKGSPS